ncbi:MAG: FkbM family methyltransferase [Candidatus Moranbacteria bacterium]|nr:FkbM family methyltransferase [Candidatus Moranbacteria bacterium]
MISYAQNFEDIILWRALKHVSKGFYIDVGAFDPQIESVTKWFYDNDWRGINVEPLEKYYDLFLLQRPKDINLNFFVSDTVGDVDFYESEITERSTGNVKSAKACQEEYGYKYKNSKKKSITLNNICKEQNVTQAHFLKIDVEGFEINVLRGFSFDTVRPWIVLFEAVSTTGEHEDISDDCVNYLESRNYHQVYFDGLNKFFVADEHKELDAAFNTPLNIFDQPFVQLDSAHWLLLQEKEKFRQMIQRKDQEMATLNQAIQQKSEALQRKDIEVQQRETEIAVMEASKFWKMRGKYISLKNKLGIK